MKKLLKSIVFIIIGISILGIMMYNISLYNQEKIFNRYDIDFNPMRKEMGLKEISNNWKSEKFIWNNWNELSDENNDDDKLSKFRKIFNLKDIRIGVFYKYDLPIRNTTFQSKSLWINSNILFWRNEIESEMDIYENKIDSMTTEVLLIRYYFKDDNRNENYFECDYSVYEFDGFYCGTGLFEERERQRSSGKPYFGNITKKQADSILKKWKEVN